MQNAWESGVLQVLAEPILFLPRTKIAIAVQRPLDEGPFSLKAGMNCSLSFVACGYEGIVPFDIRGRTLDFSR